MSKEDEQAAGGAQESTGKLEMLIRLYLDQGMSSRERKDADATPAPPPPPPVPPPQALGASATPDLLGVPGATGAMGATAIVGGVSQAPLKTDAASVQNNEVGGRANEYLSGGFTQKLTAAPTAWACAQPSAGHHSQATNVVMGNVAAPLSFTACEVIDMSRFLSIGSIGHPRTCGNACRYVKRKGGCREGIRCPDCHSCQWTRKDKNTGHSID